MEEKKKYTLKTIAFVLVLIVAYLFASNGRNMKVDYKSGSYGKFEYSLVFDKWTKIVYVITEENWKEI